MRNKLRDFLQRVPRWLRIIGGIILGLGLSYVACSLAFYAYWISETEFPCVDGEAGSPAIFRNGGTNMFTFPESATNIENMCYVFQSAGIQVWFEMEPEDLAEFLESMRWDVQPVTPIGSRGEPAFGKPRRNGMYQYWQYENFPEAAYIWIDTSEIPYRIYVEIVLD